MTGPRIVDVVVADDAVGGGPVEAGVVPGADPAGTVVGDVELPGTLVGTSVAAVDDVATTTDVVEEARLVGGTDVSPSSPDEHPASNIARATAAPTAHCFT